MQEPEKQQIIEIVKQYETAYREACRSQIDKYKKMEHVIPDFLKGYRDIDIIFALDGVIIVHWDSNQDQDSFSVHSFERKISEITWDLSYIPILKKGLGFRVRDGDAIIRGVKIKSGDDILAETPWVQMTLTTGFSNFSCVGWSKELAKARAVEDIQTFIISHLMGLEGYDKKYIIDHKEEVIFSKLERILEEFKSLLNLAQAEEEIQKFLNNNPILIAPSASTITPKVKLGSEYITDFVITILGDDYILVEIEKSLKKLYNRSGDPSADLTHAIRQAEDWRRWVQDNISYARQTLPNITDPNCWIIIGRRKEMTSEDIAKLKRKNLDNQHITIFTYDDLADNLKMMLDNLRKCADANCAN